MLEPVDEKLGNDASPVSATLIQLQELLRTVPCEGFGLEYEKEEVLKILVAVFSDPRSKNRRIRFLYTGLHMSYDPLAESLTVGDIQGIANPVESVLTYMEKNIPRKDR